MVMLCSRCGAPNGDCTDQSGKLSVHSSENIELSGLLVVILFIIGWEMLDKLSGYGVTAMPLPATLLATLFAIILATFLATLLAILLATFLRC